MSQSQYIAALLTLLICVGIFWSCLCRLNMVDKKRLTRFEVTVAITKYAGLMSGALVFGFAPVLFREWPGFSGVMFSGAVLVSLVVGAYEWKTPTHNLESRL